ncbi:MAG TPA: N-acetylmuramoyl-L-alanine amidase [Coxiellaceae bacterium]|nr:N-acetylmuramoyl-L-alanine amidase [Coxiellaceae bacterium]
MYSLKYWLTLIVILLPLSTAAAPMTQVQAIRSSAQADQARLVLVASGPIHYQIFELQDPARLVIDLDSAQLGVHSDSNNNVNAVISGMRSSQEGNSLRLVFDLKFSVQFKTLVNSSGATNRLIVDLRRGPAPKLTLSAPIASTVQSASIPKKGVLVESSLSGKRDIVIVIDPGHGGKDTGAIGPRRSYEKNDVLAISKQLQKLINQQKGFKAVLTRSQDYYLTLRQRLALARKYKADMFIAIHADAFRNREAHGASVYALSQRGATSEAARWLAERENESELMGGVELNDKDNMLKSVLLNLSQTATIQSGLMIGHQLLSSMGRICPLHHRRVEQAAFVVLKSPDIPSVLVECGFISNWQEEAKLKDPRYQYVLASALTNGLVYYFKTNPPPGTWLAQQRYKN